MHGMAVHDPPENALFVRHMCVPNLVYPGLQVNAHTVPVGDCAAQGAEFAPGMISPDVQGAGSHEPPDHRRVVPHT